MGAFAVACGLLAAGAGAVAGVAAAAAGAVPGVASPAEVGVVPGPAQPSKVGQSGLRLWRFRNGLLRQVLLAALVCPACASVCPASVASAPSIPNASDPANTRLLKSKSPVPVSIRLPVARARRHLRAALHPCDSLLLVGRSRCPWRCACCDDPQTSVTKNHRRKAAFIV